MKVIITFTFCSDNLWKSKFMALEKPGKLRDFFVLFCGHCQRFFILSVLITEEAVEENGGSSP